MYQNTHFDIKKLKKIWEGHYKTISKKEVTLSASPHTPLLVCPLSATERFRLLVCGTIF